MATVTTEVKKSILQEMKEELNNRDYCYQEFSLNMILARCFEQKNDLIDLFSKHPCWNPDKLMIQFDTDIERRICTDEVYKFVNWLSANVNGRYNYYLTRQTREYRICNFINSINKQFFDESMSEQIDYINGLNENFKLRTNMKASKAIGKICREEGWDKLDGYNQKYAALCDALNPLKIKRHTVISLNPIDFLLMSNGNSWESCHYINNAGDPGCYSSGTISYMLDNHSFVFYTVDASYNGNQIEREKKIQRQMFGYNDEVIAQLRLYPQSNDCGAEEVYNDIRAIVQKVISDCLGKPNMWIKSKNDVEEVIRRGSGATCYPDWRCCNPGAEHCTISTHKERVNGKENRRIVFGAKPICIDCGHEHYDNENISCCEAGAEYCENCGERIYGDEIYWVDGYAYCEDCVTYCEDCDSYVTNDYGQYIDGNFVCDHCINDTGVYRACEECGEIHYIDNMVSTEDGHCFCADCAEDKTYECEECGDVYLRDEMIFDDKTECFYCPTCYNDIIEERIEEESDLIAI